MDKSSYDIVGDAVSKFWREKCFPMNVVCFFYQKYDYWQDDEWEWREEFASPVSDSDYDKVLFQNDFCEGQSVVKDLVIVPFDEVTGYYTKNVIAKDKETNLTSEELFSLDINQNAKDIDSGEDDSYYRGRLAGMLSAYRILKGKPYEKEEE